MTTKNRSEQEQQGLNHRVRRKDVLEWILLQSLHAEPASQDRVKRFLTTAPPEVFVLLDGLMPPLSTASLHNDSLHESRIMQGFVGLAMERRKRGRSGLDKEGFREGPESRIKPGPKLRNLTAALGLHSSHK